MHPKTEELLYLLLWTTDNLRFPTIHNLTESFESWAYRKGLSRQLARLETQQLVRRMPSPVGSSDRLYRLTEQGRIHALGGHDPIARWSRPWDGRWRLVVFDIPREQKGARERLRRFLRSRSYGCLQGSVWVTPDPPVEESTLLKQGVRNVESLILLEARPCAGESDAEIVAGAWDFDQVRQAYDEHRQVLEQLPGSPLTTVAAANELRRWAADERAAWLTVTTMDPFLPESLWPPGYPGRQCWDHRLNVLASAKPLLAGLQYPV
jgi:phenylacetic acid degradation operon negative regulatory protein